MILDLLKSFFADQMFIEKYNMSTLEEAVKLADNWASQSFWDAFIGHGAAIQGSDINYGEKYAQVT